MISVEWNFFEIFEVESLWQAHSCKENKPKSQIYASMNNIYGILFIGKHEAKSTRIRRLDFLSVQKRRDNFPEFFHFDFILRPKRSRNEKISGMSTARLRSDKQSKCHTFILVCTLDEAAVELQQIPFLHWKPLIYFTILYDKTTND